MTTNESFDQKQYRPESLDAATTAQQADAPDPSHPLAVCWDMDGTLLDSEVVWNEACRDLAGDHLTPAMDRIFHGAGTETCGIVLHEQAGVGTSVAAAAAILERRTLEKLEACPAPTMPGALELAQALKHLGITQLLVTASPRVFTPPAKQAAPGIFAHVVAADDLERTKPHPDPYLHAANLAGQPPETMMVLEDSATGVLAALRAGIPTLCIGATPQVRAEIEAGRQSEALASPVYVDSLRGITPEELFDAWRRCRKQRERA